MKSILDIPATLERLETLGVAVVGYRTSRFPGFYLTDSGQDLDWRLDTPEEIAAVMAAQGRARRRSPRCSSPTRCRRTSSSTRRCTTGCSPRRWPPPRPRGIRGKAVTPFLLDHVQRATEGASVLVNLEVARGNITLAGQIAAAWASRGPRP